MKLVDMFNRDKIVGVSGFCCIMGNFGIIDGAEDYETIEEDNKTYLKYKNKQISIVSEITKFDNDVYFRRDKIINLREESVFINKASARFVLDGSKYEVYTQFNGWQHESSGAWQKLVTQVSSVGGGIRTCQSATPIMALHNVYTKKNIVFHLLPNSLWKMNVKKFTLSDKEIVVVELGLDDENLNLEVNANSSIDLPQIVFYSADNKVDLDAHKLHQVYNTLWPRKKLPILFNTWLYCFDHLDVDDMLKQIDTASEMGIEAFMIDAGWFGYGNWAESVGDWVENQEEGLKGRMMEVSNHIREKGMIFGLWFEPERAGVNSKAIKENPDFYIENRYLDFSNHDAVDFIFKQISSQIDKFNIGWLKFDFNDSIPFDRSGNAYYYYFKGQREFVERIKERYPNIYITNCAGGGSRMELYQGIFTDSFWLSDNQGPFGGIRIVKDTIKRMPSSLIERWIVQKYSIEYPQYSSPDKTGMMLSCNNALWDYVVGIKDSFNENFALGGPLGFSCDIASFPVEYKKRWSNVISEYKKERDFYINAQERVLIDEDDMIAIEYSNINFDKCVIQIFTKTCYSKNINVYPMVKEDAKYTYNEQILYGKDIKENGLLIDNLVDNSCVCIKFFKVK